MMRWEIVAPHYLALGASAGWRRLMTKALDWAID
jgi:hypothetical protein